MSTDAAIPPSRLSSFEQLRLAQQILRHEGRAILALADRMPAEFAAAAACLFDCPSCVIVTGMGKAGLIGKKVAATLASTGTPSHFVHPAEALHGDLGRIRATDVVLALSFSGETDELVRVLPTLRRRRISIVAITAQPDCSLGRAAAITLPLGRLEEACPLGLAPSTSTSVMLALGDALALVVSGMRNFGPDDFAHFHPGGSLGRRLSRVEDVMRPCTVCRHARDSESIRRVLITASMPGRRSGAIMLTDEGGRLSGIFTDSDLARLLETRSEASLDTPIAGVMTTEPLTVTAGTRLDDAVTLLAEQKISELPVVDADHRPLGMIDITDLVGFIPSHDESPAAPPTLRFPSGQAAP